MFELHDKILPFSGYKNVINLADERCPRIEVFMAGTGCAVICPVEHELTVTVDRTAPDATRQLLVEVNKFVHSIGATPATAFVTHRGHWKFVSLDETNVHCSVVISDTLVVPRG